MLSQRILGPLSRPIVLCSYLKFWVILIYSLTFNAHVGNGYVLRVHATDGNLRDTLYLVNGEKINGEKISTTNGNFAHKSFIETEFSYDSDAKETWLACQGY